MEDIGHLLSALEYKKDKVSDVDKQQDLLILINDLETLQGHARATFNSPISAKNTPPPVQPPQVVPRQQTTRKQQQTRKPQQALADRA